MKMDATQPIDAVVMWVDGSSDDFQRAEQTALEEERAKGKTVVHSAARHRDNGELRYLLRSIEQNMPWIRHIYVVTNGQKPDYIDFSVPGISQVSHSDIFSNDAATPCFNSFVIDSYLHNIEGLSENFIRFSDDFFIGRSVEKEEFLKTRAAFVFKGEVQEQPKTRYQAQVKRNAELMKQVLDVRPKYNVAHAPQLRNIPTCKRFEETYRDALMHTRSNRFRTKNDLIPLMLYPYFVLSEVCRESIESMVRGLGDGLVYVPKRDITERYAQVAIGREDENWAGKLNKIQQVKPLFFNLNDNFGAERESEGLEAMDTFLATMFPVPSRFERSPTKTGKSGFVARFWPKS